MNTTRQVLVAEDDKALGSLLTRALASEGYEAILVSDGDAAVASFNERRPNLAILDLGLPKLDGLDVLKAIRTISRDIPVLILTAASDLETRLQCFNSGADDCMLKPFALRELRARCNALIRRDSGASTMLRHADLEMNRLDHSVRRSGLQVALTNKEYELLEYLLLNQGRCVSRSLLMEQVWKSEASSNTNVVDVYINYLRRKLNELGAPSLISTIRGKGYQIGTLLSTESLAETQA